MTYYSVLDITPTTNTWIPEYLSAATKLVAKYGGKYLTRTGSHEQLEGKKNEAALRVILEWPSKEAALTFMNDSDYAKHFKGRTDGSISNHYLIEAKDDFA